MLPQILIATREMMIAEPTSAIGTQGGRMNRLQDQMATAVNHFLLAARIAAPKQKHQPLAPSGQQADDLICKLLPTQVCMAVGLVGTNRQRRIEQQDTLARPTFQVARHRDGQAKIGNYFLENILQRWWERHAVLYGEAQSMRLSGLMIRVLPDNHCLNLVKRA